MNAPLLNMATVRAPVIVAGQRLRIDDRWASKLVGKRRAVMYPAPEAPRKDFGSGGW